MTRTSWLRPDGKGENSMWVAIIVKHQEFANTVFGPFPTAADAEKWGTNWLAITHSQECSAYRQQILSGNLDAEPPPARQLVCEPIHTPVVA